MEEIPTNRRINCRLSLRVLLFVAIVALLIARLSDGRRAKPNVRVWDFRSISGDPWAISYGSKNGDLLFVIFVGASKHEPVSAGVSYDSSENFTGVLRRADGSEIPLDGRKQLFECVDGKDRESDDRVTLEQFKSFIFSNPEAYNIDSLLQYSKARK